MLLTSLYSAASALLAESRIIKNWSIYEIGHQFTSQSVFLFHNSYEHTLLCRLPCQSTSRLHILPPSSCRTWKGISWEDFRRWELQLTQGHANVKVWCVNSHCSNVSWEEDSDYAGNKLLIVIIDKHLDVPWSKIQHSLLLVTRGAKSTELPDKYVAMPTLAQLLLQPRFWWWYNCNSGSRLNPNHRYLQCSFDSCAGRTPLDVVCISMMSINVT